MKTKKETYLTKTELKSRGWTDSIIRKMDLIPDMTKQNPVYKSAPEMKLYLTEKIKNLENTEKFIGLIEKSKKRKKSSIKGVETKRNKTINYVNSLKIVIPKISLEELKKCAIDHYNSFLLIKEERNIYKDYSTVFYNCKDFDFLNRIQVNYIRHELTDYEEKLRNLFGKVGKSKAYKLLKCKILDEISKQYPMLKEECYRQKN